MTAECVVETDVLVIGGALSGLFASIKARDEGVQVVLVDKGYVGRSGAAVGSDRISVFNPDWGHDLKDWMDEVAVIGDYMNSPEMTEITLRESYDRYLDLVEWGVTFPRGKDGELIPFPHPPYGGVLQSYLHNWKDTLPVLRKRAVESGVTILDRIMVTDLLKHDGRVTGAVGFHCISGDFCVVKSRATVQCTGTGILEASSRNYLSQSTYEGEAFAYRAGAEISGKEFSILGACPYSYIPAKFGYGGKGDDAKVSLVGKEIKPAPPGSGSQYSMLVDKHLDSEGYKVNRSTIPAAVHLGRAPFIWNVDDITPEEVSDLFESGIVAESDVGLDLRQGGLYQAKIRFEEYIGWAVVDASGIAAVDTEGGTNLLGLFAAGDAYNSRAGGAQYPFTGFGTRNAMVLGARAGRRAAAFAKHAGTAEADPAQVARLRGSSFAPLERQSGFDAEWIRLQLRTLMSPYYILYIKHGERLKAALTLIEFIKDHLGPLMYAKPADSHGLRLAHEAKGGVTGMEMMLRAALFRTESRGVHYREDYPFRDDPDWLAEVIIKDNDGQMQLEKRPLPRKDWPDLTMQYGERYPLEYLGEESLRRSK